MLFTHATLYEYSDRLFSFKTMVPESINLFISDELNSSKSNTPKEKQRQEDCANEFMMRLLRNNRNVLLKLMREPGVLVRAYDYPCHMARVGP